MVTDKKMEKALEIGSDIKNESGWKTYMMRLLSD